MKPVTVVVTCGSYSNSTKYALDFHRRFGKQALGKTGKRRGRIEPKGFLRK
jgi:hypothetical protein